jgi:hypothetical protein
MTCYERLKPSVACLKVLNVKPLGVFICFTLKHWSGKWDIHCAIFKNLQLYDVDSCIVRFRSFRFLSESQFPSQAFSIAPLFLPIFPLVDFATPES